MALLQRRQKKIGRKVFVEMNRMNMKTSMLASTREPKNQLCIEIISNMKKI